jgi:hypothetical protein
MLQIHKIVSELKLSKHQKVEIKRALATPEVKSLIDAVEGREIDQRKELVKAFAAKPAEFAEMVERTGKDSHAALREYERAQKAYVAAQKKMAETSALAAAWLTAAEGGVHRLKQQLIESADPRLQEVLAFLTSADWAVSQSTAEVPAFAKGAFGMRLLSGFWSNEDVVQRVRTQIRQQIASVEQMQLEARTRDEITETISAMLDQLRPGLDKFNCDPPTLDDFGNIRKPIRKPIPHSHGTATNSFEKMKSAAA